MIKKLKIISLVPSLTELLVALGLEENIVGITKFCIHPKNLIKDKVVVGGTKTIHLEKVKALEPDFILCNKEENTKEIVENCRKIATTHVSDLFTIEDVIALIQYYGRIFSCEKKAILIIDELNMKLKDFKLFIKDKPTLKVVYFIWKNPWMIAANNTFINHLLTLNKFENCYENLNRYPEITLEDLKTKEVDAVFLSSEPFPFKEKNSLDFNNYTENTNIVLVDGEYFSWYGSRLLKAFDYFKELRNRM
ncbi:cobalamin-binding protein [Polaribacter sp. ALD11]|uniref:ABC transporter substrate-binding protein n=1 Tax=Polaribacter sp. ALD11 TaxID=2058137 RepID=UPI000C305457|nr:helical backbone metal receptor [Polaribacter sp. ALD11]AUC85288.1 cobalamin-binding protein [Polaribacter sp. ALD11]